MSTTKKATAVALAAGLGLVTLSGCAESSDDGHGSASKTVTLVSHSSFAASEEVLEEFEKESGYTLKVLEDGDAGVAVNKAILTKGNPQGDVFFGIDNTLLSRGLDNDLFTPYEAAGADSVRLPKRPLLDKQDRVTLVDTGEICVNYDKKYFADKGVTPPETFDDLVKPAYKNLLVVENPATSSPGLGFLMGTVAQQGGAAWPDYWKKLKDNGVKVVDGWDQAYNEEFSGSAGGKKAGGDRPLVVSYASSPPVEAIYSDPKPAEAPTGVSTGTCFQQAEYAGLLAGAKNPEGGKALLDFMSERTFQADLPLNMFVDPVHKDVKVPADFARYAVEVPSPLTMDPERIADHRDQWVKQWTSLVVK
ncbi:thiamine ABC transporter substrate binding subunit [Streptomyces sp. NPDC127068]|uniref:thiamine ABC transporter substrate-binding protein n=1 Tax=Streptomyces sp. NPDC127068 TaxID=3347127 RepID=UPI0036579361